MDVGTGSAPFDPNTSRHDHFVCRNCQRVIDVHAAAPAELAGAYAGFEVDATSIVFRGTCPVCVPRTT